METVATLTYERLLEAVERDAAIRCRRRLKPAGGAGDKIFPSTYPGRTRGAARHVFETRRINGEDVRCVLVDSVQSQANRLEVALLARIRKGIQVPYFSVQFDATVYLKLNDDGTPKFGSSTDDSYEAYDLSDIGEITSLDAPHRAFDAIIRDSLFDNEPFKDWAQRNGLYDAKPQNATALLKVDPASLLFGVWNSTGTSGGLGTKFPRCIVSEIIGVNAVPGRKVSSRLDPLGIQKTAKIYQSRRSWTPDPDVADKQKAGPVLYSGKQSGEKGRPSLIVHGNIPPTVSTIEYGAIGEGAGFEFFRDRDRRIEFLARYPETAFDDVHAGGGVTVDYALQIAVITCAGLRRLRFPELGNDAAWQTVLAGLGLVALSALDEQGYALRSRCNLYSDGPAVFEIIGADGKVDNFTCGVAQAQELLERSVKDAPKSGFWKAGPTRLRPQENLCKLIAVSRANTLAGQVDADEASLAESNEEAPDGEF